MIWLSSQAAKVLDGSVVITTPVSSGVAPPGKYMLFAVVDGIPSVAAWVQLGGDPSNLSEL
ncbi:hypothetical protein BC829DRAFT_382790, partial [Chytridium lagenaria]